MIELIIHILFYLNDKDNSRISLSISDVCDMSSFYDSKCPLAVGYSDKDALDYSSKDAKAVLDFPDPLPNPLDRMFMPIVPPLPISPRPVTEVNP
jgi:hypothetical protein